VKLVYDLTEYTLRIIEQGISQVRNCIEYLCCGCSFVKMKLSD
jgi:hypothetical protein